MSSNPLPLQIRKDIRDYFTEPNSKVAVAQQRLTQTLGLAIDFSCEWPQIWADLKSVFPDASSFIPAIAAVVAAWYTALVRRIDEDEAWGEKFVDVIGDKGTFLILTIGDVLFTGRKVVSNFVGFAISIPKNPTALYRAEGIFGEYFANMDEHDALMARTRATQQAQTGAGVQANPTTVNSTAVQQTLPVRSRNPQELPAPAVPTSLPLLDAIPQPFHLFASAPYHLRITIHSQARVVISGSHEPSIMLMYEYLRKYLRKDPQRAAPYLTIELRDAYFGFGLVHDTIVIEPYVLGGSVAERTMINVALLQAFVESILGYKDVSGSGSEVKEYRRDAPFSR